jgi:predicted SAM-dependent methyltransferase
MKIEIGGQRRMPGWTEMNNRPDEPGPNFNIITDEFDIPDNSVEYFYMSHVIEHVPIICAEKVFRKFFGKLKSGGKLRILCPDLEFILKCYIEKDTTPFNNNQYHLGTVTPEYMRLGIGGMVMCQMTSGSFEENDSYLFTARENGKYLCTFSHVAGWDFEMLSKLLNYVGFVNIERTGFEEIDPHRTKGQLCLNAFKP